MLIAFNPWELVRICGVVRVLLLFGLDEQIVIMMTHSVKVL